MNFPSHHTHVLHKKGFTLPVILIICVSLMIIGLSLVQTTSSIYDSLNDQYLNRLADEAAEAGVVYANYCLSDNDYIATWGSDASKPNLTQKTDCDGTTLASAPSYVADNASLRTSFSVGNLDVRADGAIIISATGTVEQTVGATSTVSRSYNSSRKQVVKWQNFTASKSTSGYYRTCAIISKEAWCWGVNDEGELGLGDSKVRVEPYNTPQKVLQETGVLKGKTIAKIAAGYEHTCVLTTNSLMYCWGANNQGQLGPGYNSSYIAKPILIAGALAGKTITDIGTYYHSTCAIADGKIYCWGQNSWGTVGDNTGNTRRETPTLVSTTNLGAGYTATKLAEQGSGTFTACAILSTSQLYCWGQNTAGQTGTGSPVGLTAKVLLPTLVGGLLTGKTVTNVSLDGPFYSGTGVTEGHTCATADAKVYCWGGNPGGQVGNNTTTDTNVPVAVRANSGDLLYNKTIVNTITGWSHSCALTTELKAYCWGRQGSGQLGNNVISGTNRLIPVAVSVLDPGILGKTISELSGGGNRGCVTADAIVYCWGENSAGQLGDGTFTDRGKPTESVFLRPKAPTYIF